jgi:ankyrin repeat protein
MGNSQSNQSRFLSAVASGDHVHVQHCITQHAKCLTATAGLLNHNQSALHLAARHGRASILSALLAPLVDAVTNEMLDGNYPGDAAAALEWAINRPDSRGRSPLLVACSYGQWDCADRLLEAGANVLKADKDGNGVLHQAIVHNHLSIVVQLLLKAEEQSFTFRLVNSRNSAGLTPLHYAAWTGNSDVAQQLLLAGADQHISSTAEYDPWLQVNIGTTPLHVAALQNDHELSYVLLQQYAADLLQWVPGSPMPLDPRTRADHMGRTPLEAALWKGYTENKQLLACLNPSLDLRPLFSYQQLESMQRMGPSSLKTLASAALKYYLLEQLEILKDQRAMQKERRREQERRAQQLEQKLQLLEKQRHVPHQQQQQQQGNHEHEAPPWQRWWSKGPSVELECIHAQQQQHVPGTLAADPAAAAGSPSSSSKTAGHNNGKNIQQLGASPDAFCAVMKSGGVSSNGASPPAPAQLGVSSSSKISSPLHAESLEGLRRTPSATVGAIQYASIAEVFPEDSKPEVKAASKSPGAASAELVEAHVTEGNGQR